MNEPSKTFKVLSINRTDLPGARFNGFALRHEMRNIGVNSEFCVWEKLSDDPGTFQFANFNRVRQLNRRIYLLETKLSIQSLLYINPFRLPVHPRFKNSDILHFHLLCSYFFSLLSLPVLTWLKPSVLTVHDTWSFTGHCITPMGCERWVSGCGNCPDLAMPIEIMRDNTRFMWWIKRLIFMFSKVELIVSSKWMLDLVKRSPILKSKPVHFLPFGIDIDKYKALDRKEVRKKLNIPDENVVIGFRASTLKYKGTQYIIDALRKIKAKKKITIIATDIPGMLEEFKDSYQIIDFGWINECEKMVELYSAMDLFLMPSLGESFGMMAVEAMACGVPVIVFEGTALPSTVFAPIGGIAVKPSSENLMHAIIDIIENDEKRYELSKNARKIVEENYDGRQYGPKLKSVYERVMKNRGVTEYSTASNDEYSFFESVRQYIAEKFFKVS